MKGPILSFPSIPERFGCQLNAVIFSYGFIKSNYYRWNTNYYSTEWYIISECVISCPPVWISWWNEVFEKSQKRNDLIVRLLPIIEVIHPFSTFSIRLHLWMDWISSSLFELNKHLSHFGWSYCKAFWLCYINESIISDWEVFNENAVMSIKVNYSWTMMI